MKVKIYDDDVLVPYKDTKISKDQTRAEIDGLLARWGIRDSGWHWDLENQEIFITFQMKETVGEIEIQPLIRVDAPLIYHKKTRAKPEWINWNVSMRVLFWYLKSHLEAAYLRGSSKTAEFLPQVQVSLPIGQRSLGEVLIPQTNELSMALKALPTP